MESRLRFHISVVYPVVFSLFRHWDDGDGMATFSSPGAAAGACFLLSHRRSLVVSKEVFFSPLICAKMH